LTPDELKTIYQCAKMFISRRLGAAFLETRTSRTSSIPRVSTSLL